MVQEEYHRTTTKLGSFMALAAWLLLFFLLIYVFDRWLDKQNNPNRNLIGRVAENGIKEITLAANRYNYYVVDGKINDVAVTFIVDTGATDVVVPSNMQYMLHLVEGDQLLAETANGKITVFATYINKLEIGPIQLSNVKASINPEVKSDKILLGMSALRKLEFTHSQGKLTIRQK